MQLSIKTLALLSAISFSGLSSAVTIAFGQELQNDDQTNHWVTWTNGEHACPGQQVLGVLTESPCNQPFTLGGVEYSFGGCDQNDSPPTTILNSSGTEVGICKTQDQTKITCHDGLHDILKHGTCDITNSKARSFRV